MIFPKESSCEGFEVDVSLMEAIKHFNELNIGSLAVGEKGLVSMYAFSPHCQPRDNLC